MNDRRDYVHNLRNCYFPIFTVANLTIQSSGAPRDAKPISWENWAKSGSANNGAWPISSWQTSLQQNVKGTRLEATKRNNPLKWIKLVAQWRKKTRKLKFDEKRNEDLGKRLTQFEWPEVKGQVLRITFYSWINGMLRRCLYRKSFTNG